MTTQYDDIALVLQGGGALGSYQAGAYEVLAINNIEPTWVAGVSIGALNAAIIAGNPPEKRVEQLKNFWMTICSRSEVYIPDFFWDWTSMFGPEMRIAINKMRSNKTIMKGQKGFFIPKFSNIGALPLAQFQKGQPDTLSYYDTSHLKKTLLQFADFDLINSGAMRVSLGVVNVKTGLFSYFDNTKEQLLPEHFMASGALPPSFPAVEIDGQYYWDGGIVCNSPILEIVQNNKGKNTLVFQIDLWNSEGQLPNSFDDISHRMKDIQFSSRNKSIEQIIKKDNEQAQIIEDLLSLIGDNNNEVLIKARQLAKPTHITLEHITYQHKSYENSSKDYEFSVQTMNEHWNSGLKDMNEKLLHKNNAKNKQII
jgi:NTE family protein